MAIRLPLGIEVRVGLKEALLICLLISAHHLDGALTLRLRSYRYLWSEPWPTYTLIERHR
jgi:hypothetical protein